jgi:acetoin utilization deacetylase AcuC-like enzyme
MNRRDFVLGLSTVLVARTGSPVMAGEGTGSVKSMKNDRTGTGFVFDEFYLQHEISRGHPESPHRLESVMGSMERSGLIRQVKRLTPLQDANPWLLKNHTQGHIESIRQNYPRSHRVVVQVVAGALGAVRDVCAGSIRNAFCAIRPPGHHALNTGKEEGFCYYNTIAIAARYARQEYGLKKILIVDWDYHHGNGTEAAFYSDPGVLFFSTHDLYAYPGTGHPGKTGEGEGKGYNINVHLDCGTTDREIIAVFEKQLMPVARRFKPDMILISAGFDSRVSDPLGCFNLSDQAFVRLTRMLMELADQYCDGRIVSLLEGGYNPEGLASAVTAHVKTLLDS